MAITISSLFLKTQSGVFKLLVLSDRQSKLQRLSLNKDMKENEGAANVHIREAGTIKCLAFYLKTRPRVYSHVSSYVWLYLYIRALS